MTSGPDQVGTYSKSTTHSRLGRLAVKSRPTRSGGRVTAGSDLVVTNDLPRRTPLESHQPLDPAAGNRGALAAKLVPHLAGPVQEVTRCHHGGQRPPGPPAPLQQPVGKQDPARSLGWPPAWSLRGVQTRAG